MHITICAYYLELQQGALTKKVPKLVSSSHRAELASTERLLTSLHFLSDLEKILETECTVYEDVVS